MGNKPGKRKVQVEEQYTKPQGLYETREINLRQLKKLIVHGKLAPCYIGVDEAVGQELEECPICLLCYPSLNRSLCCGKGICTECFLQLRPPPSSRVMLCPFCKTPTFAVEYRGEKTAEEKGAEAEEEQKILEARIRQQEEERRADEERQGRMRQDPHFQRTLQQELLRQQLTLGAPSTEGQDTTADSAQNGGADDVGPSLGEGGRSQSAREGPPQALPLGSTGGQPSRSGIFSRVTRRGGSSETNLASSASAERTTSNRERSAKQSSMARSLTRKGASGIQPSQLLLPRAMVASPSASSASGAVTAPLQVTQVSGATVTGPGVEDANRRVQQLAEQYFDMSVFSGDEEGSRRATPYARLSLTPEHSDPHQQWLTRARGNSSGAYSRAGAGASSSAGVTPNHINATSSADVSGALSLASPPPPQYPPTRFNLIVPRNQPGLESVTHSELALSPSSAAASGQGVGGPVGVFHHHQHVHQHIHEHLFTGGGNSLPRDTSEAAAAAAAEAAIGGGRVPVFQHSPSGEEEQGMDLDDILLMQAIWMSLQEQPGQDPSLNGTSMGVSMGPRGGDGEAFRGAPLQAGGAGEGHGQEALGSGSDTARVPGAAAQGGSESELDVPDDFEEQMKLALAISLAEANEDSQEPRAT